MKALQILLGRRATPQIKADPAFEVPLKYTASIAYEYFNKVYKHQFNKYLKIIIVHPYQGMIL